MKHEPLTNKDFLGILCSINGHKEFEQHPLRANDMSCTSISLQLVSGLNYTACILALRENQCSRESFELDNITNSYKKGNMLKS